jgi:hypothetical protein
LYAFSESHVGWNGPGAIRGGLTGAAPTCPIILGARDASAAPGAATSADFNKRRRVISLRSIAEALGKAFLTSG